MASNYLVLNNFSKSGQVRLSRALFESIAEEAINEVKMASPAARKNKGLFKAQGPAKVAFRKDGKVDISLDVSLSKTAPVKDVCMRIQESVASAVQMMCETVPFSIKVRVTSLT